MNNRTSHFTSWGAACYYKNGAIFCRSVHNLKNNMTIGSEWKHIVLFSLPIMLGNLLQQLYNTVDGIVVGNYVSESALAAVGSCTSLAMVFLAAAMGLGGGAGIMISQYYGAKMETDMRKACSTALLLLVSVGAVLSVIGVVFARGLCSGLLKIADTEILDMATTYFAIYSAGLIFQFCYNTVASILRAVGDSKATLYFLLVSALLNIALDVLFVSQFGWGVAGVGIATVISQLICTIVSIIYMFKKYPIFRFRRGEFVFDREKCALCLKLGIPTTLQQCVVSFGNVFIQRLVNSFGQVTMSAYTVGMRIENYVLVPIFGFNIGLATFTGQNLGAGKIDRIRRAWKRIIVIGICVSVAVASITYIFATPLSSLFGVTGDTLDRAVEYIHFLSKFFFMFAAYMITGGVLQGSGDVVFSSMCTLSTLTTRVIVAYVLVYALDFGYAAAWVSIPFGWSIALVLVLSRYASGRWSQKGIVKKQQELKGE